VAVEKTAPEQDAQWYVVHAYSGHEEKVKKNLEKRIESMDMQDKILQVLVPMEDEIGSSRATSSSGWSCPTSHGSSSATHLA
jgi:hypothetical protein